MAEESVSEKATLRDHIDNPIVVLIIFAVATYAIGGFGRSVGNRFNLPGVTTFFGG